MNLSPSGKPTFSTLGQTFVEVTEATANVTFIKHAIQQKWGSEYTLVTADGLELEDCSGTQGKHHSLMHVLQLI
ncbi:MAG: hypothetical protein MPK75_04815 [Alphaproteobacteria bacterium]|nr:hypothetical protein [Alphaproteobacteria bacterium]